MPCNLNGLIAFVLYITIPILVFGIEAPETPLPSQFIPVEIPITKSLYENDWDYCYPIDHGIIICYEAPI